MIRRCAEHQPHADSFGTAARNGERVLARTDWGIGHFDSDWSRAMNVPAGFYPAFKLLDCQPRVVPGVEEPLPDAIGWHGIPAEITWRNAWEHIRAYDASSFVVPLSSLPPPPPREVAFHVMVSDVDQIYSRVPLMDIIRAKAQQLPEALRPPRNATYRVVSHEPSPFSPSTIFHVTWSAP